MANNAGNGIDKSYENMPKFSRMGSGGAARFAPGQKPRNAKSTLLRLAKDLLKWRKSIVIVIVLTLLSAGVSLLMPLFLGRAINTFNIEAGTIDAPLLTVILIALAACYLAAWGIDTINGILMAKTSQKMIKHLRTEFFAKLQRTPLNFYDTHAHGDTMSRVTNDVDNISNTIAQTVTQLLASVFTITGSAVMMLVLSPTLTLVALVSIPLFLILTRTISRHSRKYFLGQQQKLGVLNGVVEENITGLKMVKAFNRQQKVRADFEALNRELCDYSTKAQVWAGFMMPFMNVINNLSFGFIACAGGILSVQGAVTVGVVVSFLTYSKQFSQPLNNVAGMFNNVQSALAGAERIFEILDGQEEAPDNGDAVDIKDPKGEVEFRKVSFAYHAGAPVLKAVSFKVSPGETLALVGETGAGKTTIVNLLTRFYESDQGEILIDGIDIRDISRKSLRNCFSVVLQDTYLFTGTIYDNIRYSRPEASEEEVIEAAKLARADAFITRLPDSYSTVVTGSTDNLSQGQRQLIAIARAMLFKAPILILDEATSSVDTKTEKEIQRALLSLMKDRTSFLIAHRLSTIRDADRIIVIGGGEILETGTHDELMREKGVYHGMVVSQLGLDEKSV